MLTIAARTAANSATARRRTPLLLLLAAAAFGVAAAGAAETTPAAGAALKGAAAIIAETQKALLTAASPEKPAPSKGAEARQQLEAEVKAFGTARASMPVEKQAAAWLTLFDRFWALPPTDDAGSRPDFRMFSSGRATEQEGEFGLQTILLVMPGPEAWPALRKQLAARPAPTKETAMREHGLSLLVYWLNADLPALANEAALFKTAVAKRSGNEYYSLNDSAREVQRIVRRLRSETVKADTAEFEETLAQAASTAGFRGEIRVPDLVALAGEAKALELIGKVLTMPGARLFVTPNTETARLAARLALERVDKMTFPQWDLVACPEATALFEAIDRKFPVKTKDGPENETDLDASGLVFRYSSNMDDEYRRPEAAIFYILGLLLQNRIDDAVAFAGQQKRTIEHGRTLGMRDAVPVGVPLPALFAFFVKLAEVKPERVLESDMLSAAVQLGKIDEFMALLERALKSPDLPPQQRFEGEAVAVRALLAADRIEPAVARMLALLKAPDPLPDATRSREWYDDPRPGFAKDLIDLGRLLNRPDWTQAGVSACQELIAKTLRRPPSRNEGAVDSGTMTALDGLVPAQKFAEAEAALAGLLAADVRRAAQAHAAPSDLYPPGTSDSARSLLLALATLYDRTSRPQDVLTLLEQVPWWGERDLLGLLSTTAGEDTALAVIAGTALHKAGRQTEAERILKAYLSQHPGDDTAYQVLAEMLGPALIPWLDTLYARNRFEERPLIWKAVLLQRAGKLDAAEAVAREALRVDPTDGEQKKGWRVYGYTVLADILEAKGKADDAVFFRKVVKAVRIAEEGDELNEMGLIRRSLAKYEEAEGLFADAYCVQWRLAARLSALGRHEEAEKHYRLAFERMPEQFGQMASFCFGCEGAFSNPESQSVGEKVLAELEKKPPVRPQVFYLLGQLREEQQRLTEACDYFRKATATDPGYLDAWRKLAELGEKTSMPAAERDTITLTLLRLQPLVASNPESPTVSDPAKLWNQAKENLKFAMPEPASLLPLKASQAELDKSQTQLSPEARLRRSAYRRSERRWDDVLTPAETLLRQELAHALVPLLMATPGAGDQEVDF